MLKLRTEVDIVHVVLDLCSDLGSQPEIQGIHNGIEFLRTDTLVDRFIFSHPNELK